MTKKVQIEMPDGRLIRVMPHLVQEMTNRFGASTIKKIEREAPKELIRPNLPKMEDEPVEKQIHPDLVKKTRKAPVKSKSTK